jgi:hypothetical protein
MVDKKYRILIAVFRGLWRFEGVPDTQWRFVRRRGVAEVHFRSSIELSIRPSTSLEGLAPSCFCRTLRHGFVAG